VTTPDPVLDPDLEIVDPHHHLWDRNGHRYLAEELRADLASGHNVTATVYVECKSGYRDDGPESLRPCGETEFVVRELSVPLPTDRGPIKAAAGIVAYADVGLGDAVEGVLDTHEDCANGRLRGIRYAVAWHAGEAIRSHYPTRPGLLAEPAVRNGIAALGRRGLSFDVWAYFTQLGDVTAALDACPDTLFVLNHCGGPIGIGPWRDRRGDVFAQWRTLIGDLARRDNIVVKLGGLGMPLAGFGFHKRPQPPHSRELAEAWSPFILDCIEAFGPERCMFESNWPVDATAGHYSTVWNAFKRIAGSFPDAERNHLFALTARRIYRIS
jgi:predicted TIM-barrel fold metal-dependent hydrolase